MRPVKSFVVRASIPEILEPLREISFNRWWYWNVHAVKLFYRMDRDLWEEKYHNPVNVLGSISQERLNELALDEGIQADLERVKNDFYDYMKGKTWFSNEFPQLSEIKIAYFSLEFGLSESIPIYSGGLGILAGDHLKSASDLGIPLVGVGLLYQEGYFKQYLNNDGWQGELYTDNDFYNMPVTPLLDSNGEDFFIELDFPDGSVRIKIWKIQVGRVPLFLLDTNLPENENKYRNITSSLYGGDHELRLKQEILLGIGGLRALQAIGIWPAVCHMNEGHAAFLALERIRTLMEQDGLTFDESFELASAGNIFTTHTPVEAGQDRFPGDLVLRYFKDYYPEIGLTPEEFLGLGPFNVGGFVKVRAMINLGSLSHEDVAVELYTGMVDSSGSLIDAEPIQMQFKKKSGKNCLFEGMLPFKKSGKTGFSVRVLPDNPDQANYQDLMLVKWAL